MCPLSVFIHTGGKVNASKSRLVTLMTRAPPTCELRLTGDFRGPDVYRAGVRADIGLAARGLCDHLENSGSNPTFFALKLFLNLYAKSRRLASGAPSGGRGQRAKMLCKEGKWWCVGVLLMCLAYTETSQFWKSQPGPFGEN